MAQQQIGLGGAANDGTGDTLRAAGSKLNAMFAETYRNLPAAGAQRSIGERLRRAKARALLANPLVTPPLIVPPAYAPSTLYQRGQIVLNGGNLYICVGGSTAATLTGTSGTGAGPTGTVTLAQADNTVTWAYIGQPHATASDALAPTVTTTTSPNANTTFTALSAVTYLTPSTTLLTYFGTLPGAAGFQAPTSGSNKTFPPASYYKTLNNTTTPLNNGGVVQFNCDAPKIAISVGSSSTVGFNFRVVVDCFDGRGWRYVQQSAFVVPAGLGDPQFGVLLDWSGVGGRKARAYRLETSANTGLNSVRIAPTDDLWLTTADEDIKAYCLSDSWGEGTAGSVLGSGPQLPCMGMGWQMTKRLGISNCLHDVAGGTGYIATNGGSSNNYQTRAAHVADFQPDIVFVDEAIINDGASAASAIQTAAATTFATIRAASAAMPIVVFGAGVTTTASQTSLLGGDNAVAAAVAAMQAAGDPNIWFLSRITDPQGPWSRGTGRSSAPAGDGNSDFYTSSDGAHRTDMGVAYEGRRMADAFSHSVLPFIP